MQADETLRALAESLHDMVVVVPGDVDVATTTTTTSTTNNMETETEAAKRQRKEQDSPPATTTTTTTTATASPTGDDVKMKSNPPSPTSVSEGAAAAMAPFTKPEAPTVEAIHHWLALILAKTRASVEVTLVAVLYIRRLMAKSGTKFTNRNWRSLLATATLLASKVWDDLSLVNKDYAAFLPYTLREINRWERLFCAAVQFDLSVSNDEFADLLMDLVRPQLQQHQRSARVAPRVSSLRRTMSETVCEAP